MCTCTLRSAVLNASTCYNFWFTSLRALVRCVSHTRHDTIIKKFTMDSVPIIIYCLQYSVSENLLSPTLNLDGKRGEENVSGSKEPRKLPGFCIF